MPGRKDSVMYKLNRYHEKCDYCGKVHLFGKGWQVIVNEGYEWADTFDGYEGLSCVLKTNIRDGLKSIPRHIRTIKFCFELLKVRKSPLVQSIKTLARHYRSLYKSS